jgi:hypothetical protein
MKNNKERETNKKSRAEYLRAGNILIEQFLSTDVDLISGEERKEKR